MYTQYLWPISPTQCFYRSLIIHYVTNFHWAESMESLPNRYSVL